MLLRRLVRELRYRALSNAIGRKVVIESLDRMEAALRAAVAGLGLEPLTMGDRLEPELRRMALAKYGVIDATLEAPAHLLAHVDTRSGIALLEELGFVSRAADAASADDADACFGMLVQDLDENKVWAKVFLRTEPPFDIRDPEARARMLAFVLPDDFFPHELIVEDACITNCEGVWINKHFYL